MTHIPTSPQPSRCDQPHHDIAIVVAIAHNNAIGQRCDQPFLISEDLKHFRRLTTGNTIVMGRRTYEALPKGALPNRRNIVVTHNHGFSPEGTEAAHSLQEAIDMAAERDDTTFIIGGGEIYRQAIERDIVDRIYVTEIDADAAIPDTFFPEIDPEKWVLTEATDWAEGIARQGGLHHAPDKSVRYRFICYCRK